MKIFSISHHYATANSSLDYVGEVLPPIGVGDVSFSDYWQIETAHVAFFLSLFEKMNIYELEFSALEKGYKFESFPYVVPKGFYKYSKPKLNERVRLDALDNLIRMMLRVQFWGRLFHNDDFFLMSSHDMTLHFGIKSDVENIVSNFIVSPLIRVKDITKAAVGEPEFYFFGKCFVS